MTVWNDWCASWQAWWLLRRELLAYGVHWGTGLGHRRVPGRNNLPVLSGDLCDRSAHGLSLEMPLSHRGSRVPEHSSLRLDTDAIHDGRAMSVHAVTLASNQTRWPPE